MQIEGSFSLIRYSSRVYFLLNGQGSSDIDQLGKIFQAFGTPKPAQWPDMVYLPEYVQFQYVPAPPLRSLFPMASDDALDLLSKMFTYDPRARISSRQALEHRFVILSDHSWLNEDYRFRHFLNTLSF